jgi:hypothetical protein
MNTSLPMRGSAGLAIVRACALLALMACVQIPTAAIPAALASSTATDPCVPVRLLTFRGSGEDLNGGHGETMTRIVTEVNRTVLKNGFKGSSVPATAIPYPAVAAEKYVDPDKTDLFDSIEYGRVLSLMVMQSMREDCPTKFVLAGYSQGVIVARQVALDMPTGSVIGVLGVGDPAQRGDQPHVSGGGSGGDGIYRWITTGEDSTSPADKFYDAGIPHAMWCHPQDWICNFYDGEDRPRDAFNPVFQTYDHTYAVEPAEAVTIGAVITKWASDAIEEQDSSDEAEDTDPSKGTGPIDNQAIDVMFSIDTTGSMEPYLAQARDAALSIADTLRDRASVVRVGVVEYRDDEDDFRARVALPLTTDEAAFQEALDGLEADGGGDDPESVYSGVMLSLNQTWEPDAIRSLVVLGDAEAKDPEPGTGFTRAAVTAAMRDLDAMTELPPTLGDGEVEIEGSAHRPSGTSGSHVRSAAILGSVRAGDDTDDIHDGGGAPADVSLFAVTTNDTLAQQVTPIAEATGGVVAAVENAREVSDELVSTMNVIASKPSAALTVPSIAVAGHEFTLAAAGSTAMPGSTFSFDADSDGTPEGEAASWAQRIRLPEPGDYTATVTITDPLGRTSSAAVAYAVTEENDFRDLPVAKRADTSTHQSFLRLDRQLWITGIAGLVILLLMLALAYSRGRSYSRRQSRSQSRR